MKQIWWNASCITEVQCKIPPVFYMLGNLSNHLLEMHINDTECQTDHDSGDQNPLEVGMWPQGRVLHMTSSHSTGVAASFCSKRLWCRRVQGWEGRHSGSHGYMDFQQHLLATESCLDPQDTEFFSSVKMLSQDWGWSSLVQPFSQHGQWTEF